MTPLPERADKAQTAAWMGYPPGLVTNPPLMNIVESKRFWRKVAGAMPDQCWEWQAYRNASGYGVMTIRNKQVLAHRLAARQAGMDLEGAMACHHCDNPCCVNPKHLYAGNAKTNAGDAVERDRFNPPRGEAVNTNVMSQALVEQARYEGWSPKRLASEGGVTSAVASKALRGDTWKQAAGPLVNNKRISKTGHVGIQLVRGRYESRPRKMPARLFETLEEAIADRDARAAGFVAKEVG